MAVKLPHLQTPDLLQDALDEYVRCGSAAFLEHYGYGRSRDILVRDPKSDEECDSKAIPGETYGYQFPEGGPLKRLKFVAMRESVWGRRALVEEQLVVANLRLYPAQFLDGYGSGYSSHGLLALRVRPAGLCSVPDCLTTGYRSSAYARSKTGAA